MADPIATGLVGVQIIMTVVTLGFTTGNSLLRFAGLFGMLYISYFQVPYIARVKNPMARGFLANAPFVLVILYIDKLLLNKWTFAANGPTSAVGGLRPVKEGQSKKDACRRVGDKSIFRRLRFGLNNTLQARFPATNWPVKNIPTFSRSRPDSIPDRTSYLRGRIIRWIAYVLILDLAGLFNNNSSNNAILFAPANIPLLSRLANVSKGEAIERVILVMAFWVFQYIGIQVVYGFFAILGIASGLWPIEAWPPMFGFIGDCYSIRQFWGCFYHQLLRRACGSIAYSITYILFRLRRGGFVGRYLFILLTFAVSGAFHACSDVSQGIPWRESGAIRFFCIQTLGIMIEDAVQAMLPAGQGRQHRGQGNVVFGRAVGYLWVVLWLAWTTPKWSYPMMRRDQGGKILPFTILAPFLKTVNILEEQVAVNG